jgi:hypothetical protein
MRKISTTSDRMSALTARLASPFLRQINPRTSSTATASHQASRNSGAHALPTDREFADAAVRMSRTIW